MNSNNIHLKLRGTTHNVVATIIMGWDTTRTAPFPSTSEPHDDEFTTAGVISVPADALPSVSSPTTYDAIAHGTSATLEIDDRTSKLN
jgi:hypothetical protein